MVRIVLNDNGIKSLGEQNRGVVFEAEKYQTLIGGGESNPEDDKFKFYPDDENMNQEPVLVGRWAITEVVE
jgi:hypothetical protein